MGLSDVLFESAENIKDYMLEDDTYEGLESEVESILTLMFALQAKLDNPTSAKWPLLEAARKQRTLDKATERSAKQAEERKAILGV